MLNRMGLALGLLLGLALVAACARVPTATQTPVTTAREAAAPAAAPTPTKGPSLAPTPAPTPTRGPTPAPAAAKPKYGGTLTMAGDDPFTGFDPHKGFGASGFGLTIYDSLLRQEADGTIVPELAERYTVSPDQRTITIQLRKGVTFHNVPPVNGRELTVEDVVWSLQRISRPEPEHLRAYVTSAITKYETPDRYTVTLSADEPFAPLLSYLAHSAARIVPKVDEAKFDFRREAVGTGFMILESSRPGVSYTVRKNPKYWDKGLPYLDGVLHLVIPDTATQRAAFRTGKIDLHGLATPRDVEAIKKTNPEVVVQSSAGTFEPFKLNNSEPPFTNRRVRYAMSLAVDRQEAIKLLGIGSGRPFAFIHNAYGIYQLPMEEILKLPGYRQPKDQDIAEAKRLLSEAGYPNGFSVPCLSFGNYLEDLPVVAKPLEKVGIKLEIVAVTGQERRQRELEGRFKCVYSAYSPRLDPDELLYSLFHSRGSQNIFKYSNPEIDRLLEAQRSELEPQKRAAIIHELVRKLHLETPIISVWERSSFEASQPWVKGYNPGKGLAGYGFYLIRDIWLDK